MALGQMNESPPKFYPTYMIIGVLYWFFNITIFVTVVFLIIAAINKITAGKNIRKYKITRNMMICAAISAAIAIIVMLIQGLITLVIKSGV